MSRLNTKHCPFVLSVLLLSLASSGLAETLDRPAHLRLGISVSDLGNPYFAALAQGAKRQAQALVTSDQVETLLYSSAYDVERQTQQIESFIEQSVDMILVSAAVFDAFEAVINRAKSLGIPVLAVDVKALGADATVTTHNYQAGHLACDQLAQHLNFQGEVVILNGPPVSSIIERVEGCQQALAQYPAIRLISSDLNTGGSREGGLETMTHVLTRYPDIQGVFSINDPAALGAEMAGQQAGKNDFVIASVDGAPSFISRLQADDSLLLGTATQSPAKMAELAVQMGYDLLQGKTLNSREVLIPARWVNADNLDAAEVW